MGARDTAALGHLVRTRDFMEGDDVDSLFLSRPCSLVTGGVALSVIVAITCAILTLV